MRKVTLTDFRESALKKLGEDSYNSIEEEAELIANNVINMQGNLSSTLKTYIEKTGKGFNEIQNDLGISSNKLNSIIKGQGNFTLKTISEVGAMLGKKTKIIFE